MEEWRDIHGYEGLYQVSNYGNVKSLAFGPKNHPRKQKQERKLKISKSSSGYMHVQLYKNGVSSTKLVHKLVATAFIENISNKLEVNHIDGNKENNHADNLEWVTRSENLSHAISIGVRKPPMLGKCGKDNKHSKCVLQYTKDGAFIKKWFSIADAARFYGCTSAPIRLCIYGKHKTALGFVWTEDK